MVLGIGVQFKNSLNPYTRLTTEVQCKNGQCKKQMIN